LGAANIHKGDIVILSNHLRCPMRFGSSRAKKQHLFVLPRKPQRVLMTADAVGGVWTYVTELVGSLSAAGIEVAVATMGPRLSRFQRTELMAIPRTYLFESDFKLEWMDNAWADLEDAGPWLLEIEEKFQPDVIQCNGYYHAALPWTAPVVAVAHSCVLSWWNAVHGAAAPAEWDLYRRVVRRGIRSADAVIAPSRAMLDEIGRWYAKPRLGAVIPNGRDSRRFRVASKQPYVLGVGRAWDEAKNISMLDAVAADLEWPVYVAGADTHPDGNSIELHNTKMLGEVASAELGAWLASAPICALPARYEPFGLCALEAALSGCALVLGDIPSLRENWNDAAMFVSPSEPRALGRALRDLIAHQRMREDLARRAYHRAREFDSMKMGAAYLDIYRNLMAGPAAQQELAYAS
jgi:glycogen(starch) synthase